VQNQAVPSAVLSFCTDLLRRTAALLEDGPAIPITAPSPPSSPSLAATTSAGRKASLTHKKRSPSSASASSAHKQSEKKTVTDAQRLARFALSYTQWQHFTALSNLLITLTGAGVSSAQSGAGASTASAGSAMSDAAWSAVSAAFPLTPQSFAQLAFAQVLSLHSLRAFITAAAYEVAHASASVADAPSRALSVADRTGFKQRLTNVSGMGDTRARLLTALDRVHRQTDFLESSVSAPSASSAATALPAIASSVRWITNVAETIAVLLTREVRFVFSLIFFVFLFFVVVSLRCFMLSCVLHVCVHAQVVLDETLRMEAYSTRLSKAEGASSRSKSGGAEEKHSDLLVAKRAPALDADGDEELTAASPDTPTSVASTLSSVSVATGLSMAPSMSSTSLPAASGAALGGASSAAAAAGGKDSPLLVVTSTLGFHESLPLCLSSLLRTFNALRALYTSLMTQLIVRTRAAPFIDNTHIQDVVFSAMQYDLFPPSYTEKVPGDARYCSALCLAAARFIFIFFNFLFIYLSLTLVFCWMLWL
jgi:hypothetical protein